MLHREGKHNHEGTCNDFKAEVDKGLDTPQHPMGSSRQQGPVGGVGPGVGLRVNHGPAMLSCVAAGMVLNISSIICQGEDSPYRVVSTRIK